MRKKLYEDVNTIYRVTGVIFPDVEETEEFDSKEDAMNYAQEQISSGNYDEVIASEVTIDEDGYENETILLDEQCEHERRYFFRIYFHDEDQEELFAVDDGGYDFEPSYETEEEALEAMKKILKDPKVQADPEIAGCHSVFVPDTENVREVEKETGYEEFEVVDWIDKENLEENFKSKDKYSVLREALDRLDREDNRGKKSKVRAQVRNLRSKLK